MRSSISAHHGYKPGGGQARTKRVVRLGGLILHRPTPNRSRKSPNTAVTCASVAAAPLGGAAEVSSGLGPSGFSVWSVVAMACAPPYSKVREYIRINALANKIVIKH
jgi:hypothetical protein